MPLPVVAAGAAKLLAIPGVKEAAMAGAQKLAANVYGRVMASKSDSGTEAAPGSVEALVADLPTREEIVAAFALLQADIDRRHRHTLIALIALLLSQVGLFALLII